MEQQVEVAVDSAGRLIISAPGVTFKLVPAVEPPPVDPPPVDPPPPPVDPPPTTIRGVIIDLTELLALPTEGPAWNALHAKAKSQTVDGADLGDMHMQHDVGTLAVALAGMRLGDAALILKARNCLEDAIGTESGGDSMDVGRSLAAYVMAADVLGIRSGRIFEWLDGFRTRLIPHDNTGKLMTLRERAWETGTNASCQVGLCSLALAVYLRDEGWIKDNWDAFRRIAGDRTSPFVLKANQFGDPWQEIPADRVGIQNKGAVVGGVNVDGAYVDMGRSNPKPVASLRYDSRMSLYPWVSLNSVIWAAKIFDRLGYPAFELQDQAVLRAVKYLRRLSKDYDQPGWWGADKKEDAKWIAKQAYNLPLSEYPISLPVADHDQIGWADWLYPEG